MLERGLDVWVKKWHPHLEHMQILSAYMQTPFYNKMKPEKQARFKAHFDNHNMYAKLQEQTQAQELGMTLGGGMGSPQAPPTEELPGKMRGNELGREAQGMTQGV